MRALSIALADGVLLLKLRKVHRARVAAASRDEQELRPERTQTLVDARRRYAASGKWPQVRSGLASP